MTTPEDFNQPSPERVQLLEALDNKVPQPTRHFWAFCQICSLDSLTTLVHREIFVLKTINKNAQIIVDKWQQKHKYQNYESRFASPRVNIPHLEVDKENSSSTQHSSSPLKSAMSPETLKKKASLGSSSDIPSRSVKSPRQSSTTSPRSRSARDAARCRDTYCVLSGHECAEVTHIYPFALLDFDRDDSDRMPSFWNLLCFFWSEEQISTWQRQIFLDKSNIGVETPANMLTLTNTAHSMWNTGRFAIKPVWLSDDKRELKLQFFWQRTLQLAPGVSLKPSTVAPSSEGLDQAADRVFLHKFNNNRVSSGDIVVMNTTDIEKMPLPSWELLNLQWALQRVAGMAGAAEPISWYSEDDSDDADVDYCDFDEYDDGDYDDDYDVQDLRLNDTN